MVCSGQPCCLIGPNVHRDGSHTVCLGQPCLIGLNVQISNIRCVQDSLVV